MSFSRAASTSWAAISAPDWSIGVDAAEPAEFRGSYPFHRVFQDREFRLVSADSIADEDMSAPAAFLWSVKEAVAKALGCGFHLIEPLDVRVVAVGSSMGDLVPVQALLSGKALERFPRLSETVIDLVSLRHRNMWVSIAIILERFVTSPIVIPGRCLCPAERLQGAAVSQGMESLRACTTDQ